MSCRPFTISDIETVLDAITSLLRQKQAPNCVLVGIDGRSGAGKSTLAAAIGRTLEDVTIVHKDDFYRVMKENRRFRLDALGGYHRYFDWERLLEQVLQPLRRGEEARYQRYDWERNRLAEWVSVAPLGTVLIEGVYAIRPELRPYYDLTIYVETSEKERLRRQLARTDSTDWISQWAAAETLYVDQYQPQTYADFVIRGAPCEAKDYRPP